MAYSQLEHFVKLAIEIAEEPIRQDTLALLMKYHLRIRISNTGESGMRLYYDEDDHANKDKVLLQSSSAEIFCLVACGRLIRLIFWPYAKCQWATKKMARWFGHKKPHMNSVYMQEGLRTLFRHIAEAEISSHPDKRCNHQRPQTR